MPSAVEDKAPSKWKQGWKKFKKSMSVESVGKPKPSRAEKKAAAAEKKASRAMKTAASGKENVTVVQQPAEVKAAVPTAPPFDPVALKAERKASTKRLAQKLEESAMVSPKSSTKSLEPRLSANLDLPKPPVAPSTKPSTPVAGGDTNSKIQALTSSIESGGAKGEAKEGPPAVMKYVTRGAGLVIVLLFLKRIARPSRI